MPEIIPETPELPVEGTPIEDFGSVLDDWLAGASLTRVPVAIYGKQALFAEYEKLTAERELLDDEDAELAIGERSRLAEIDERLAEIYDEWTASKSVWILEDVSGRAEEITEKIGEAPEAPKRPGDLPKRATETAQKSHTVKMQKYEAELADYEKAAAKYFEDYGFEIIALALVRIEFADGRTQEGVTAEQVRKLAEVVGEKQVARLNEGARAAMRAEPVISSPFSRDTSPDDTI